jgi:hypothetical protein
MVSQPFDVRNLSSVAGRPEGTVDVAVISGWKQVKDTTRFCTFVTIRSTKLAVEDTARAQISMEKTAKTES